MPAELTNAVPVAIRHRRVTVRDIATTTKLSLACVSLALHDRKNVAPKTATRVKAIALALGYRPDPARSALAAYRSKSIRKPASAIAFASNWNTRDGWVRCCSCRALVAAASRRAAELGYALQHFWVRDGGSSPGRSDQILKASGIRGLIVAPPERPADCLPLDWSHYLVVSLGRTYAGPSLAFVESDGLGNLRLCYEHLITHSGGRIGFVVPDADSAPVARDNDLIRSFAELVSPAGAKPIPVFKHAGTKASDDLVDWLERYQPDAVISSVPGFSWILKSIRSSATEDLQHACLNTAAESRVVSGIDPHLAVLGSTAVDLLHWQFLGEQTNSSSLNLGPVICGSWIEARPDPTCPSTLRACARNPSGSADGDFSPAGPGIGRRAFWGLHRSPRSQPPGLPAPQLFENTGARTRLELPVN